VICIFVFLNFIFYETEGQKYEALSPDRNIRVSVEVRKSISYTVKYKNSILILPSVINMSFQHDLINGGDPVVSDALTHFVNREIIPVVKEKKALIFDNYRELIIHFKNHFAVHFRVYDDGVAYRFATSLPGDLLKNDLVYRLAPDAGFSDFSWIKPGKSTEEWITGLNLYRVDFEAGLNTQTYKYYIDFAARFGFQYVMLDAGWSDVNCL